MLNDGVDVRMSDGRLFHARGPTTVNARSPMVERRVIYSLSHQEQPSPKLFPCSRRSPTLKMDTTEPLNGKLHDVAHLRLITGCQMKACSLSCNQLQSLQ